MEFKTVTLLFLLSSICSVAIAQTRGLTQSSDKVCIGETVRLTASGCNNTVMWSNGKTGISLLDTVSQSMKYTAVCIEGENIIFNYEITLSVQAIEKPRTPYLMCNDDVIKKGKSTKIKTFGCVGTVNWSTGETGSDIKVSPDKTTTYTAICSNANNCAAEPISRTIIVYEDKSDLEPKVTWRYGCNGETVIMTADGCTAGTYVWYKHKLILGEVSTTEEIKRGSAVEVNEGGNKIFYTARCQFSDCLGNESNRLQLAFLEKIDTPEIIKSFSLAPENPMAIDLTTALNKPITSGGIYEFRATNNPSDPLLTTPTQIKEVGTYYVRERSRSGNCVSEMAKITVSNNTNGQGAFLTNAEVVTQSSTTANITPTLPIQVTQSTDTGAALASVEPNAELDFLGIPDAFSPNGDNINDVFLIKNLAETNASLRVYNRYGHLVYDAPEYKNDWKGIPNTGIFTGSTIGLPDGTYYYSLQLQDGRQKISFLTIAR